MNKVLSIEELTTQCPQLLTNKAVRDVSEKYVHIPSMQVVEDIMSFGWQPVKTDMRGKGKSAFDRHSVTFEHPSLQFGVNNVIDSVIPRVTFVNAHNGLCAFKFYGGLFRLVCSNGLVIPMTVNGESMGHSLRIRHIHYNIENLKETLTNILKVVQTSVDHIFQLDERMLTETEKKEFAKMAWATRNRIKQEDIIEFLANVPDEVVDSLIEVERAEDEGDSAWKVLNIVQEKILGGFQTPSKKHRPIQGFERQLDLNAKLYESVMTFTN